ncbi:hypothetical protein AN639_05945 [Candidatus Epulonipiscium fishelsonii]|uniref:Uncharacterized protein n=1 Tax=Candidatus Epulonipiscium fishelsonii TaxID=77094 RepID=A0ACC8XBQ6_9FIRM|nr:hypothetical protein AN639_05945 [Epulopiscium sp. SCG-B05WGA-EpuloA1]ONI40047.1 hypothetical protein AN396_06775 [Epulopiscium sp. SCG-B11WGA-EpuloA1]
MRHEIKKIAKITDELTTFFLKYHAKEMEIKLEEIDQGKIISLIAKQLDNIEEAIKNIKEHLSYERSIDMEEYYWKLADESECNDGLSLVGVMVDEASLDYSTEESFVYIELIRKHEMHCKNERR